MNPFTIQTMKLHFQSTSRLAAWLVFAMAIHGISLQAQTASQTVTLTSGWNAVWLEVTPVYQVGDSATIYNEENPNGTVMTVAAGDSLIGVAKRPEDVFPTASGTPRVLTVITPKALAGTAEFFASDPSNVSTFNQDGWEQWHNPIMLETDNLSMVTGNRAYLVEASDALEFTVEGSVRFFRPTWTPDRFNLIGFGLAGTPTFKSFFEPSGGKHPLTRINPPATVEGPSIFRLDSETGNWDEVGEADTMISNEAYWIFSAGASDYMGPVAVDFDGANGGRLDFGGPEDAVAVGADLEQLVLDIEELVITNLNASGDAVMPELDLIVPDLGSGQLALHVVTPASDSLSYERGNQVDSSPGTTSGSSSLDETVPPAATNYLSIGAQRNWAIGAVGRTNVYRLSTSATGAQFWLPISALNNAVQLPTDLLSDGPDSFAGLWVGEASVNAASSIVVDGAPVLPAVAPAPLRVLLHSDSSGAVRFLSQVTLMQTRTADPDVPAVPVLVVNPAQIPIFEGVKERNGKRVGIRIEAIAFDMPRDTSSAAQSDDDPDDTNDDLLDMIVAESTSPSTKWLSGKDLYPDRASVTPSAIDSYLLFRGIRPPALEENYLMSLPVDGALGAGKTVQTQTGTLVLDPFHRSNPFRHAFHQGHPKGPKITRELTIVLDSEQSATGSLRGTYREDIKGLTKSTLTLTGTINLSRVSKVGTLEGVQ